jgi:hypothetical protein
VLLAALPVAVAQPVVADAPMPGLIRPPLNCLLQQLHFRCLTSEGAIFSEVRSRPPVSYLCRFLDRLKSKESATR